MCAESSLVVRCGSEPALKQTSVELPECQSTFVKLTMVDTCLVLSACCSRHVSDRRHSVHRSTMADLRPPQSNSDIPPPQKWDKENENMQLHLHELLVAQELSVY